MAFVVGLDWGRAAHAVCFVERESGAVVDCFVVAHDAAGRTGSWDRDQRSALYQAAAAGLALDRPGRWTGLFGMDTGAADELRLPVIEVEREVIAIRHAFNAMSPWRRAYVLARRCALEIAFAVEALGSPLAERRPADRE